jgi:hypothetical protein
VRLAQLLDAVRDVRPDAVLPEDLLQHADFVVDPPATEALLLPLLLRRGDVLRADVAHELAAEFLGERLDVVRVRLTALLCEAGPWLEPIAGSGGEQRRLPRSTERGSRST